MLLALTRLLQLTAPLHDTVPSPITIHSDSQLVVEQIQGNWKVRDAELRIACAECQH